MNAIFSSRVLEAKFDRSKKFKVDIASDEKKEWVCKVWAESRVCGLAVTNWLTRAEHMVKEGRVEKLITHALQVLIPSLHASKASPAFQTA